MPSLQATCEHCGASFRVPESKGGGIVNCPECGKITTVKGPVEVLFVLICAVVAGFILLISGSVALGAGPIAGLVVLLVLGGIAGLCLLAM